MRTAGTPCTSKALVGRKYPCHTPSHPTPYWKHYVIPVGQYDYGQQLYLFFANDHDVASPTAESYFKNVQLYNLPPTPTPTATFTITSSATSVFTPSATSTPTPTPFAPLPTNTSPPNSGGSGICWASKRAWAGYSVSYAIDRNTIPTSLGWDASIHAAAQTWNNVTPSHFEFVFLENSNNIISYRVPPNEEYLAQVYPHYWDSLFSIVEKQMDINPYYDWDTNNTPDQNNPDSNGSTITYNVQNLVTHEFGHWLQLEDFSHQNCGHVTMYHYIGYGEISKITLNNSDEEAINWQYP